MQGRHSEVISTDIRIEMHSSISQAPLRHDEISPTYTVLSDQEPQVLECPVFGAIDTYHNKHADLRCHQPDQELRHLGSLKFCAALCMVLASAAPLQYGHTGNLCG
jgi:hypothetical protein